MAIGGVAEVCDFDGDFVGTDEAADGDARDGSALQGRIFFKHAPAQAGIDVTGGDFVDENIVGGELPSHEFAVVARTRSLPTAETVL